LLVKEIHMATRIFPFALFLCFLALLGCSSAEDGDTIRVGVAGPMTGDQARNGEELWLGATLAAEEWNEKGGVLGKKIDLLQKDDQALETEAKKVANELIDAGVAAVIGHYNSGVTFPASQEYGDAGIPMITPAATNPEITDGPFKQGVRTVFRVCGRDDVQGATGAEFVANVLKLERVAVFHDKTIYGQGLAEAFKEKLEELGVTITLWEGFPNKERNFRPFLPKLRDDDPQLWYFGGIHNQGGPLARQAKESGIPIPFMSGDGVFHPEFLSKAGEKADGAYFTFPDIESSPEAVEFKGRYEKRWGKRTGPYSIYSYVTANILFESIEKAGGTDGVKIAEAIRGMEHQTVIGPISFDEKGDVTRSIYTIWKVVLEGGEPKFVLYDESK
jgi:branched-chain amino acid transport system substrate-binding protein